MEVCVQEDLLNIYLINTLYLSSCLRKSCTFNLWEYIYILGYPIIICTEYYLLDYMYILGYPVLCTEYYLYIFSILCSYECSTSNINRKLFLRILEE